MIVIGGLWELDLSTRHSTAAQLIPTTYMQLTEEFLYSFSQFQISTSAPRIPAETEEFAWTAKETLNVNAPRDGQVR